MILIVLVLALPGALLMGALGLLYWIAKGEPDVNGDPERDAGKEK